MPVAPSGKVAAGRIGAVVTGADPDGMAARHDFKEAYAILEVAGKSAANPSDVRDCDQNALQA
jgi:S1-C subfamily serine protease